MLLVWLELRCDGIEILVGINILVHPPEFYDLGYSVKVLSGPFRQIKIVECTIWSCCGLVAVGGLGINVLIQPTCVGDVDLYRVHIRASAAELPGNPKSRSTLF
jgi:hypothetical protein